MHAPSVWVVGATGAIGSWTARLLAERHTRLLLSGRRPDAVADLCADSLRRGAAKASSLVFDVASPDEPWATELARHGALDGVALAAADVPVGSLDALDDDQWQRGLTSKLLGTVRCLRAAIPLMNPGGRIVVLTGYRGNEPSGSSVLAGAINAGLASLVKGLSRELAMAEIAINAVSPGTLDSPRAQRVFEAAVAQGLAASEEAARRAATDMVPIGRLVRPNEVAEVIVSLVLDLPLALTGREIVVDGGETRSLH